LIENAKQMDFETGPQDSQSAEVTSCFKDMTVPDTAR